MWNVCRCIDAALKMLENEMPVCDEWMHSLEYELWWYMQDAVAAIRNTSSGY